ncbi:MAG TPA: hypothetical protein VGI81_05500 [Tepidisphaeraceae bacterium]|jgi:hypothetical protein
MRDGGANAWRTRAKLTARQRRWAEMLDSVEPGLKLAELVGRLKQPYATVQRWAAFFGYPIRDGRRERPARVDWRRIDWRKTNVQIARELGVSRERVRQVRRTSGIAPVETAAQRFSHFVVTHRERLRDSTVRGAIELSGMKVCYEVARQVLRKAGIKPLKRNDEPLPHDWRLPNRDLARIYGRSEQQIANLRFRTAAGAAKWDLRGGRALRDPAYRAALEREKRWAARQRIAAGRDAARKTAPRGAKRTRKRKTHG